MKIKIHELKTKMLSALTIRGLDKKGAMAVIEPLVEAELRGKKTHGIMKIFTFEEALQKRNGSIKIIKDKFNYALIDGKKELGFIVADLATNLLIKKVRQYENAIVGVINSYYYSMAGCYARKVAREGFVSIILNNGGPSAVVPFGGQAPIFGTNPIAVGIPTDTEPIVLDMATSEKTWGEINLAKVEGKKLQAKTFLDKNGKFTRDPGKAVAIIPFGGIKGYGLNFIFEIMTGALVGAKMGLSVQNGYDLGFLFMAFSPTMFTTPEKFTRQVSQLKREIKQSKKMPGVKDIYLPGEQSDQRLQYALALGYIEIGKEVWSKLEEFASGANIKKRAGLKE